jgi:hypothetical protein
MKTLQLCEPIYHPSSLTLTKPMTLAVVYGHTALAHNKSTRKTQIDLQRWASTLERLSLLSLNSSYQNTNFHQRCPVLTLLPTTQSFLHQIGTNTILSTKLPHNRRLSTHRVRSTTNNLPPFLNHKPTTAGHSYKHRARTHQQHHRPKPNRRTRALRTRQAQPAEPETEADGRGSPAWPLCLARSRGGVIRRTTASASASYTAAAAAIAWAARREPEVPEGEDRGAKRRPATEEGGKEGGDWGRRERSRTSCLRKTGEAAHIRPRCCCWCRHAPVGRLMG